MSDSYGKKNCIVMYFSTVDRKKVESAKLDRVKFVIRNDSDN